MSNYKELREKLLRDYRDALNITLKNTPIPENEFKDILQNVIPIIYPGKFNVFAKDISKSEATVSRWRDHSRTPTAKNRKQAVRILIEKIDQQLKSLEI